MAAKPALAEILQRPDIWRGDSLGSQTGAGVPTGHAALDEALPGYGWPRGDLVELLGDGQGVGEISLLMPALARLSEEGGWLALVAPPWQLHAPAWRARGIAMERVVVVPARGQDALEMAWCCEQLLSSGSFAAVLAWLELGQGVPARWLKRLQVAVQGKPTLPFLWRPAQAASQPSPAPLRIRWQSAGNPLGLEILKRRGHPASGPLRLNISTGCRTQRVPHVVAGPVVSPPAPECHRPRQYA